jgi:PAB1-binding protein PBP1
MVVLSKLSVAAGAVLASVVSAHPGESHSAHHMKREIVARDHQARVAARSLGNCANSAASRALKTRAVQRRAEKVKELRQKRDIKARK